MIELRYWPTPNGHKITMFLEVADLAYRIHPVDISAGDQFKPEFLAFSPNNRVPAITDTEPEDGGEPVTVFGSAQAHGVAPSSRQIETWFWRETIAGQLLIALRATAVQSENNALKTVGSRFFVPGQWLVV
jgi:hypothetical protein